MAQSQRDADVETLFSRELWDEMAKYVPPNKTNEECAKLLSGRMLEEVVELHLESGGTPTSAMMHVTDAITNEAFKKKKEVESRNGFAQDAYPTAWEPAYDRDEVIPELADAFFLLATNMIVSDVNPTELLEELITKIQKLQTAKEEGRLHISPRGLFYIKKV